MAPMSITRMWKKAGPVDVFRNIRRNVPSDKRALFLAPSGSGKTTLLRMTDRIDQIDASSIMIDGVSLEGLPPIPLN